jgi:hypothetical protein
MTEPATTGPATTGPATTGPATTGPATTGPATTGPATTGHPATGATGQAEPKVEIYDTTLRDGSQQVGLDLTVADKLRVAAALDALATPA